MLTLLSSQFGYVIEAKLAGASNGNRRIRVKDLAFGEGFENAFRVCVADGIQQKDIATVVE